MQPILMADLSGYVVGLTKKRHDAVVQAIQDTCATRGLSAVQQVINGMKPPRWTGALTDSGSKCAC